MSQRDWEFGIAALLFAGFFMTAIWLLGSEAMAFSSFLAGS
jgi:hypothetical protein